jgi:rhomboid family GlyGly-CTERM serine protease
MKIPLWTLLLCGIASVVYFVPALGDAAIYDRDLISVGEWWRLITGNLAHLSALHFTYDVVALAVVGTMIELRGERHMWLVYCIAGMAIGLAVYLACPELRFYGGLSGIVSAALVYLCLDGLRETGGWRWLCGFVLVLVASKIAIEFALGQSFLSLTSSEPFIPVPVSHLAGACSAVFVFVMTRYKHGIRSVCERSPTT